MSFLFGSAPQANFNTQPTINSNQSGLLQLLTSLLGNSPGTIQPASGTFAAPVTSQEQSVLTALQPLVNTSNTAGLAQGTSALTGALTALPGAENFAAPQIDATQAFTQGVVQPLTQNFNQNVLPGIAGQFGASAGGATNTGSLMARETAGSNLTQTLADTGSQYSLGAATANQNADLAAQQARLAALGLTVPLSTSAATLPGTSTSSTVSPLVQILQAFGLPQATQQQQITGSYTNSQQSLADLIAAFSPQTQQTIGVGTGGTSGIIQSLLGGLASNAGLATLLGGGGAAAGGAGGAASLAPLVGLAV
jgi:hypothetical protein